MKIVSTSYINTARFNEPHAWLARISFHSGILEELANDHQVDSIEQINYSGQLQTNKVVYHFLNYKNRKLYFPWKLHRYIKNLDPDVVLVNGLIFPLQVIQLRFALPKKAKIVVQNHAERPSGGVRKFLQKQADRFISAYLFTSRDMGMDWVKKGVISNSSKIVEVMEGSSPFGPLDRLSARCITGMQGNPAFLWVGRLNHNKDPLTVLKAFLAFLPQKPSARLYMIFQTSELLPQARNLVNAAGKGHSVVFIGHVPHSQLQAWYNSADFLLSGSHYEGSGIAVCEAMSCGCIPVLTDIPSFRKMTGDGKCGLLYKPGDANDLLQKLQQCETMDSGEERKKTLLHFHHELSFQAIAAKINMIISKM